MTIICNAKNTTELLEKRALKKDMLQYSILFLIAALACYMFFIISGKTFIKFTSSNVDGLTQTYTAYVGLKHMIKEQGLFSLDAWSWSLGLGADTFEYFGFKLFNPFTYFIIAFPDNLIDVGYSIANVLRQYLAGLTFLLFLKEVKCDKNQRIVGAISYAFSGWIVEIVFNQGSFLNAAIVFPLLVMGVEKILKGKSPVLFIISVALTVASGVTWTYISGIIIVLFYIARYHDYYDFRKAGELFKNIGKFIASGIVGILISAPFMTSILLSMGGATTDTEAQTRIFAYSLKKYLSIPEGLFKYEEVGATSYSYIFVSIICVAMLPLLVKAMKRKSTPAWIAIVLLFLSLFPVTSKVLNGFSYPAGRWYYVLVFFMIWATVDCLKEEYLANSKNRKLMAVWLIAIATIEILLFALGISSKGAAAETLIGLILGILFIYVSKLYYESNKSKKLLIIFSAIILIASVSYPAMGRTCPLTGKTLEQYLSVGESAKRLATSPERIASKLAEDDTSFYRVDQAYRANPKMRSRLKTNANIVYGNRSVYTYSSLVDSKWSKFNKVLGNNAGYFYRTTVASNDNRSAIDVLLGVKYFLGDNQYEKNASKYAGYGYEPYKEIDGITVHKNNDCIGIGTLFDKYITESELMEYPQLVRDQVMLQAVVVPDDEVYKVKGVYHAKKSDIRTSIEECDIKIKALNQHTEFGENYIKVSNGKGKIRVQIPRIENAQIILSISGLERNIMTYDEALIYGDNDVEKASNPIGYFVNKASYRDLGHFKLFATSNGVQKYAYCEKDSPRGFNDVSEYNFNMGRAENLGDYIDLKIKGVGTYSFDSIKVYAISNSATQKLIKKLNKNKFKLNDTFYDPNGIWGEVKAKKNSILFLSIPFDRNWSVYFDDDEYFWSDITTNNNDKLFNANIAFTGLKISQDEQVVILDYKPRELIYATIISAVTILGLAIYTGIRLGRKKKHGKAEQTTEKI